MGTEVAKRIRALNVYSDTRGQLLAQLAQDFEDVVTLKDYDATLQDLYDFADRDHFLWINVLKVE